MELLTTILDYGPAWAFVVVLLAVLIVVVGDRRADREDIRARANERIARHEALPYDRDRWSA